MDKYLTVKEAASKLNISPETLRRWDNNGKFRSLRHPINNYRVYSQEQVLSLAEEMQLQLFGNLAMKSEILYEPIFKTQYGVLYNTDSIKLLKQLESNSIDLIFADPPYNIRKAEWDTFASQKEYISWSMEWIHEAQRVLSRRGSLYICGFSEILADLKWASSDLFAGCKWLVWFYRNKANLGNDWGRSHESILHLRKSNDFIFNIDEARIPYNKHTLKYPKRPQAASSQYSNGKDNKYLWEPNPLGAKPKDVLEIPTIANGSWEKYPHETQKPIELVRKIVLTSSNPESTILDPFGGSGTTYAVAEAFCRKWIGNELENKYCDIIIERLQDQEHLRKIKSEKELMLQDQRRKNLRGE